ncbi:MAG TPA: hypothetical protein VD963_05075 [Phycisphaerales bacterium]|nr:hypothetical protein [Phycisphaerales bacterium]
MRTGATCLYEVKSTVHAGSSAGAVLETTLALVDPEHGVVLDKTHPLQREAARRIDGAILSRSHSHVVSGDSDQCRRSVLPERAVSGLAADAAPTRLGDKLAWLAEEDKGCVVVEAEGGEREVRSSDGSVVVRIDGDGTILRWSETRPGLAVVQEFRTFQHSSNLMKARFPREVFITARVTGRDPVETLRVFSAPVTGARFGPDTFDWATYCSSALDQATGEVVTREQDRRAAPPTDPLRVLARETKNPSWWRVGWRPLAVGGAVFLAGAALLVARARLRG